MKLSNIRPIGRYLNQSLRKDVNLHRGKVVGRGTDVTFYLVRGSRVIVSEADLYGGNWARIHAPVGAA